MGLFERPDRATESRKNGVTEANAGGRFPEKPAHRDRGKGRNEGGTRESEEEIKSREIELEKKWKKAFKNVQDKGEETWELCRDHYEAYMGEKENYRSRMAQVNMAFSRDGGGFFYLLQQLGIYCFDEGYLPDEEGKKEMVGNLMAQIREKARRLDQALSSEEENHGRREADAPKITGTPYEKSMKYLEDIRQMNERMERDRKGQQRTDRLCRHYEKLWERTRCFLLDAGLAGQAGETEVKSWYRYMQKLLCSCGVRIVFYGDADEQEGARWFARTENGANEPAVVGTEGSATGEHMFCHGTYRESKGQDGGTVNEKTGL